jgi:putative holliday junction resolvase
MGIDYGRRRIGIALSDDEGAFAFAHAIYENSRTKEAEAIAKIAALCAEEGIGGIVIGDSRDYRGAPNAIAADIDAFVKQLTAATNLPIHRELEFMTSMAAHDMQQSLGGDTKRLDASAAALILKSFLEKNK